MNFIYLNCGMKKQMQRRHHGDEKPSRMFEITPQTKRF